MGKIKAKQDNLFDKITEICFEEDLSYMEALIKYMEDGNLTPKQVSKLVGSDLRKLLHEEASSLNKIRGKCD